MVSVKSSIWGYNRKYTIAPASVFKAVLLYHQWWKSCKISLRLKSVQAQDLGAVLHYGWSVFSPHSTSWTQWVLHTWALAREGLAGGQILRVQVQLTSRMSCEAYQIRWMSYTWQDVPSVNAFSEIWVVWQRRWVTERWHNLDNGALAFRLVHFKISLTGWSTKRKYFCVKYAVRWKKNVKLEAQVTFFLLHQDVRCNERILAVSYKSSFKRNQDWIFSGEKGFYWMCVLIF